MKIKQILKTIYITLFFSFVSIDLSFAQDATQNFKQTADNLTNNVLTSVGTLLMTAAFLFFFYGVVVFILGRVSNKGDLNDLKKGKEFMLWGLIALFIMVSVWGIIRIAQDLLDVKGSDIPIKSVQFAATPSYDSGTNPLSKEEGTPSDNKFTKAEGAPCIGLPGLDSECAKGLFCRRSDSTGVKAGESGTCQKENLNTKFKKMIDYANAKIINDSSKRIEVKNNVLYIDGKLNTQAEFDQIWKIFGEIDPEFRSYVVMSVSVK